MSHPVLIQENFWIEQLQYPQKSYDFHSCNGANDGAASRDSDASGGRAVDEAAANVDLEASAAAAASLFLLLVPA